MTYSKKAELMATTATGEVDLFQWDIVNATTFKGVNRSVVIQDKTPKTFSNSNPPAGVATIDGAWDTWQLTTGGMGNEIMMELPVKSGSTTYTMAMPSYAELSPPVTDSGTQGKVALGPDKLSIVSQDLGRSISHAFSDTTVKTGKVYFEVTATDPGRGVMIGMASLNAPASFLYRDDHTVAYQSDGSIYYGGTLQTIVNAQGQNANGDPWNSVGDTVGMAIDFDKGHVWIRGADGAWQGQNADPEQDTAPLTTFDVSRDLYPLVAVYSNAEATINLGGSAFRLGVPTGFEPGIKVGNTTSRTRDLDGLSIKARVTLQKKDNGTKTKALLVNDQAGPTTDAVQIVSITRNGVAVVPPIQSAFDAWLNDPQNLSKFDNIFHSIDYAKLASQSGAIKETMKWIAPVYSDYAVADIPAATPPAANAPEAVFAVLNQTDKSTVDKSKLAAEVSPALLAHIQGSENAVVAISAERITEEILLAGANGVAADGEDPGFSIDGDKRVVTNDKEFKMRPTKLAKIGEPVQPIVPAGGFTMRIDGRHIRLKYTGLHFIFQNATLKQSETVSFGYEQTMFLTLDERSDGSHVLLPTFNDPLGKQPKTKGEIVNWNNIIGNWTASIKLTHPDRDLTNLWIGLICAAVGLVLAGFGFAYYKGLLTCTTEAGSAADDVGAVALQDMQANPGEGAEVGYPAAEGAAGTSSQYDRFPVAPEQDYDNLNNIYDQIGSPLNLFALDAAEPDSETTLAAKPAKAVSEGSLLYSAYWGVALHGLRAMAGLEHVKQLNLSAEDIKKFAGRDVDVLGLETTVQNFLKTALSPFDWPETTGFDLTSATLQGALLLQGELKSATVKSSSKGTAL